MHIEDMHDLKIHLRAYERFLKEHIERDGDHATVYAATYLELIQAIAKVIEKE